MRKEPIPLAQKDGSNSVTEPEPGSINSKKISHRIKPIEVLHDSQTSDGESDSGRSDKIPYMNYVMPSDDEERKEEMKKRGLCFGFGNENVTSGSEYVPSDSKYDGSSTKASTKRRKKKKRKRVTGPISREMRNISFTEESDVEHDISKMFSELDKAVAKEKKKLENEKLS